MFHHQFHIIITTHSVLCQGYLKAAELILMNDQSGVTVLPFLENVPPEIFEEKVDEVIRQHASQPLLILTDLIGGTPNNTAIKQLTSPTIQLIAGINLPLLLEVLIAQGDGLKLEEINVTELVENAKSSLVHINPLLETVNQE